MFAFLKALVRRPPAQATDVYTYLGRTFGTIDGVIYELHGDGRKTPIPQRWNANGQPHATQQP